MWEFLNGRAALSYTPRMRIYEYQGRDLLASYGVPVPAGQMIESIEAAAGAFKMVTAGQASPLAVVKAQVHAGGRGKAGFVKLVKTAAEAEAAARFMLSNRMKSPQTPPEGLEVKRLLIAQAVDIAARPGGGAEEFYLAVTTDRGTRRNILIASREGGVDIEQVAHDRPEAIAKVPLHPIAGLQPFQARDTAYRLGFAGKHAGQAADIMLKLARLFVEKDCTLAEINPLVITAGTGGAPGPVMAIDAKFSFDENAIFRHKDIAGMDDPGEQNPLERRAAKFGLNYIALDGSIGCLVNGAGLAMATMDVIKLHGGEPANFLDVGGGATEEAVTEAFSIILSDRAVKGVMVNIFGGIMKCDIIAQGIVNAATKFKNPDGSTGFKVPLVVRLEGTNVEAGRKLLEGARGSLPTLQAATDLTDAAKKVCAAVA
ncbi:MAG: succinate--CoA ligase [ADP-forming] subunit beta [Phycisphaerae bacterium]|nr:MAG: succinate--CoA ligase [ADP-forming] subunit beta [Phycisphaerae bacterium]